MELKVRFILQFVTYLFILPIVWKSLMSLDVSKLFKKNHIYEVRAFYFVVTIALTKLVADFFIDLMYLVYNIMS
ncbi:DUF1146 domain-containing protein [Haloplasma contractile]|uniref:DUF1146 domain-containing protein n=1 Tax=Haloplasma contractile SSD-17B TaxID=1033810 RepID=U2E998_9MOLU|nr:DUF1146 domain-containing protein [Haloplasma contractile]ERJ11436.1 hypothetical protein HLPCO_002558 [Haloplasma contractile SSD-17B]